MTTLRRSPLDQVRCCGFCRPAIEMGIEGIDCRLAVGQVHCSWMAESNHLRLRCDRIANLLLKAAGEISIGCVAIIAQADPVNSPSC